MLYTARFQSTRPACDFSRDDSHNTAEFIFFSARNRRSTSSTKQHAARREP
jgi:hypothetical protein